VVRSLNKFDFFPNKALKSVTNFYLNYDARKSLLKRIREPELKNLETNLFKHMIELEIDQSELSNGKRASLGISLTKPLRRTSSSRRYDS